MKTHILLFPSFLADLDLPEEQVVGGVVAPDHVAVGAVGEVLVAVAAGDDQQLRRRGGGGGGRGGGQRDA